MPDPDDLQIVRLLGRFANCFDAKRWEEMPRCLAPDLYTDYSDLRGTPPETMSNVRFVQLRREALDPLRTQHLFGNHDIDVNGDAAKAEVSAVIFRRTEDGETLHTHCLYSFALVRAPAGWQISAITQKVYWSDGKRKIHAGIVAP